MRTTIRVLFIEDFKNDEELLLNEIRRGGYDPSFLRVDTLEKVTAALDEQRWDLVIYQL